MVWEWRIQKLEEQAEKMSDALQHAATKEDLHAFFAARDKTRANWREWLAPILAGVVAAVAAGAMTLIVMHYSPPTVVLTPVSPTPAPAAARVR